MKPQIGMISALLSPLNEDETIDVPSLGNLLEWVLKSEVGGLFLGGTIGEGNALRDRERVRLFKESVKQVRGRVPVLANVSDTGTVRVLENVALAAEAGVDGVVCTARLSFPSRTPDDTRRLIEAVASHSPIPVWFYENPVTTPVTSSFESIAKIASLPNVVAMKYSGSNRELFARCAAELPGSMPCFNGNVSDIAESARIGGGAISGIGSLLPGLCLKVFETARQGPDGREEAQSLQETISSVYSIYGGEGWPYWPTAQKYVLAQRGIIRTHVATAPFFQLGPREAAVIDAALERIEDWVFDCR